MLGGNEEEFPPPQAESTSDVALTEPLGLLVLTKPALLGSHVCSTQVSQVVAAQVSRIR